MTIKIAVSGIPRGYHFPRPDGNWLQEKHREQILSISSDIQLVEIPAHEVRSVEGFEVLLAEGGNRVHYPGELDWEDYVKFFTPSLKWVQLCSTGFGDNITTEVIQGAVALTNAPGIHTNPIAESVLAAILDHAKRLKKRRVDQKNRSWTRLENDDLVGRTVLIVGLGQIGKRVALLCKAFGMRVVGVKRRVEPVEGLDAVCSVQELSEYLPAADYVVLALPFTPETEDLWSAGEFKAMKDSAYLINVGRGRVVHEPTMIKALEKGWIAGAYLDAFVEEPLPETHPFWSMENVLLVPHDSHSSPLIGDRLVDLFCANLERYVRGEPLENVCDPAKGY